MKKPAAALTGIAHYIRSHENPEEPPKPGRLAAEILGIHLEGPFINPSRRGVHPVESIAKPSLEILEKLLKAADGFVRILTIAPELPGAMDLIGAAVAAKVTVAPWPY